ncbi:AMP-binding protein [Sphingoaurantiacus capsulatus]|uniref:AMP-binding protein n=1 Tax=Sphingoaurantiacus capsulatus TaxID=1771310 RepID=A0ABV7XCD7_9SPHN
MSNPLSLVRGDTGTPLFELTIGQVLGRAAASWPDDIAVVSSHQDIRLTFRELKAAADRMAKGLIAMRLAPGARIGIWSPNRIEWVVTQYAAARAGLILVCINPAYRSSELEHALNLVGCEALVMAERFKTSDYVAMLRELAPELDAATPGGLRAARLPALRWVVLIGGASPAGMIGFDDVAARGAAVDDPTLDERQATVGLDDPTNIQFTSGTTGRPKGATLTHRNLVNNAFFNGQRQGLARGDIVCVTVPLYHCFGMVAGSLCCMVTGATAVYPSLSFEPGPTLEAVARERCTSVYGVPTMFIGMLEHPDFADIELGSLRTGIMGGAPCPEAVMRSVIDDMGMTGVTIAFGMTETSPTSFQTGTGDDIAHRVETVGRVHPHIEAKVVGTDGEILPCGEPGEVLVRGYSVMRGYWDDAPRTREAIDEDRWMHTGDIGTIDADGYCRIVGRAKDLIIRGGENIYPREVEELLHTHPAIAEAQVFGIADARLGEKVCAWVRVTEGNMITADELRAFCKTRLSHFKVPEHVRTVDAFPMTVTGKPQKFLMREAMQAELLAEGLH